MILSISKSIPSGIVTAPPSKSVAHRQLIAAALSGVPASVNGLAFSDDISATLDCLSALGHKYVIQCDAVHFTGECSETEDVVCLNCRESGSTLRFLMPVALATGGRFLFGGSPRLLKRGIDAYLPIFSRSSIKCAFTDDGILLDGRLIAGEYSLDVSDSSQYLTGLMMALPLCDGDSRIKLTSNLCSASYVDITKSVLAVNGIALEMQGDSIVIPGRQKYSGGDSYAEGDWSNAAYLDALNFIPGASVSVTGLDNTSSQGDRRYPELFAALSSGEAVDIEGNIDLGPVLFALACLVGHGSFTGTRRLALKESDRIADMLNELSKFGADFKVSNEGRGSVEILCPNLHQSDEVLEGHNDHRIVMALSLLAVACGARISGAEAVAKSFPDYFDKLSALGVEMEKMYL